MGRFVRSSIVYKSDSERIDAVLRMPPDEAAVVLAGLIPFAPDDLRPVLAGRILELAVVPERRSVGPRWFAAAVRMLRLAREDRAVAPNRALSEVLRIWPDVPKELFPVAECVGRGRWTAAAQLVASSGSAADREALAHAALELRSVELAEIAARLVSDEEPRVAATAERAVIAISEVCDDESRETIERAVAAAASAPGETARRGPVLAAMKLLDARELWLARRGRGGALGAWFSSDRASGPLRSVLRSGGGAMVRARALEWLRSGVLGSAAAERLGRAADAGEHEAVLTRLHLLANPTRRRRAASILTKRGGDPGRTALAGGGPIPTAQQVRELSSEAKRGLARWTSALRLGIEERRTALEPILSDPDAAVRLSLSSGHPVGMLADLCLDSDARVARRAFCEWSLAGVRTTGSGLASIAMLREDPARLRLLGRLGRSPHAQVRHFAALELDAADWLNAESAPGRLAARAMLKSSRPEFIARLKAMIAREGEDRARAIHLARRLGIAGELQSEILEAASLTGGADPRAVATAVSSLGEIEGERAAKIIAERLHDADARVRANAVEALARKTREVADLAVGDPVAYAALIELKDDQNHRVRANAIRGLLQRPGAMIEGKPVRGPARVYEPAALSGLAAMLADERPMHRLAGAWLAARILPVEGRARLGPRFGELTARVRRLAEGDADRAVRVRARQCAQRLASELRENWAAPAGAA